MKTKIAVLGSCVTKDNFNGKFNPDYKDRYECVAYKGHSCLISSFYGRKLEVKKEFFDGGKKGDIDWLTEELEKNFQENLITLQPDILIIDLLIDVRFGVLSYEGEWVTKNDWKSYLSFYKELEGTKVISIKDSLYLDLFTESCKNLKSFVSTYLPNSLIVLNSVRCSYEYLAKDQSRKFFCYTQSLQESNKNLEKLERIFIDIISPKVINAIESGILADESHPWGHSAVHYELRFYHKFLSKLDSYAVQYFFFDILNIKAHSVEEVVATLEKYTEKQKELLNHLLKDYGKELVERILKKNSLELIKDSSILEEEKVQENQESVIDKEINLIGEDS